MILLQQREFHFILMQYINVFADQIINFNVLIYRSFFENFNVYLMVVVVVFKYFRDSIYYY